MIIDEAPSRDRLAVAVISSRIGKTPEHIENSFVFDEILRLSEKGIDIHVIRGKKEGDSVYDGLNFHGLNTRYNFRVLKSVFRCIGQYSPSFLLNRPKIVLGDNMYASSVVNVINKHDLDLIHAHFAYREGLIGLLAKKQTKKPLIVTVHGYDILVNSELNYGIRLDKKFNTLVKKVLDNSDAVIAASKATFDESSKVIGNDEKVHLIHHGIDIQQFRPDIDGSEIREKLGIGSETRLVFTLGAYREDKGFDDVIKAAALVLKQIKDVIFVLGGDGPLRDYYEQLALDLGIRDKIIFTGWISPKRRARYYAMSDFIIVPSLQEAFGLVVTEAMGCGKVVIGTNVGGIPDQIKNEINGFLIPPRNPRELANKILRLAENPKEINEMGKNARKVVEKKFDVKIKIEKIISLYNQLIK
ncbi:MAG: glycosyltransferase family 4 protein [Deltaproteobacteria bacterium]|nr:glycosyltransferase family 4 protein [Deltaproteobacteria bacterium]